MTAAAAAFLAVQVAEALEKELGLKRCASAAGLVDLANERRAGFILDSSIRIAGHYDIRPAITIYDPVLSTLGFVEHVARADVEAEAQAWAAIERATAIRQILIEDAMRASRFSGGRVLPLQVELVLLADEQVPACDPIRNVFTKTARETGYLRLIGLGALEVLPTQSIRNVDLRRAFAWLLVGTKKWFERVPPVEGTYWRRNNQGFQLSLSNYRTAGTRVFSARGDARLTLVHGHNGSGKSAIAEALELLLTHEIQRIKDAGESDYFRVVRHKPKGAVDAAGAPLGPCEVVLETAEARASVVLSADGMIQCAPTAASSIRASSFRIDQVFMDKLIRTDAAGRASIFLDAFAPSDRAALEGLQEARRRVREAWDLLPLHVRRRAAQQTGTTVAEATAAAPASSLSEKEMGEYALREWGSLIETASLQSTVYDAILPVERKTLETLGVLQPAVGEALEAVLAATHGSSLAAPVAGLESALSSLSSNLGLYIANLSTALKVFQEFRSWDVGSARDARSPADFAQIVDRWLELRALADLTSRYTDVANSVAAARSAGWPSDPEGEALSKIVVIDVAGALDLRRGRLQLALSEARAEVEMSLDGARSAAPGGSNGGRQWLLPSEVDALNRIGALLPSTRGGQPLGMRFNRALASAKEDALAEGALGRSGGLDVAIEQATELHACCLELQAAGLSLTSPGDAPLQRLLSLLKAATALNERSMDLEKNFFYKLASREPHREDLASLIDAFNELLALLTPARWAYRDVELLPDLPEGTPAMAFQTSDGASANLLFNTAELNASALTLFLLLAPRLPNKLRLLVLDDPLQNMDELTVTTVGRALAKLQVVYPEGWNLLCLLHGSDNLRLIRDEAPCDVCVLPWLQSTGLDGGVERIAAEDPETQTTWQDLSHDLFSDEPEPLSETPH